MTTVEQRMKDEAIKKLLDLFDEQDLAEKIIELEEMLEERTLQHKTQHDNALRLRAENEKLRTERSDTCRWTRPNRYSECWDTKCGNSQVIADGTPSDEEWKFCPFCGKQIEEW